jgi:hypothetical protein
MFRDSGFAWPWGFRQHRLKRIGRFSSALLLKFVNPIRYILNHIARRFTRSFGWGSAGRRLPIALLFFDNLDCFLFAHRMIP